MAKNKKSQIGGLKPKYNFILNPYPDQRISRCPFCERKTGQRKLPLVIHIEPLQLIALNYTCRYCQDCDLLIVHKHEIERLMLEFFLRFDPEMIGNDYLIMGTVERKIWSEGMKEQIHPSKVLPQMSGFINYYKELRMTQPGWYPANQKSPIMKPPKSQDWVKSKPERNNK